MIQIDLRSSLDVCGAYFSKYCLTTVGIAKSARHGSWPTNRRPSRTCNRVRKLNEIAPSVYLSSPTRPRHRGILVRYLITVRLCAQYCINKCYECVVLDSVPCMFYNLVEQKLIVEKLYILSLIYIYIYYSRLSVRSEKLYSVPFSRRSSLPTDLLLYRTSKLHFPLLIAIRPLPYVVIVCDGPRGLNESCYKISIVVSTPF